MKLSNKNNVKYWEIKNQTKESADLYLYSSISKWDDEMNCNNIRNEIKKLGNIKKLNIYINSPGGDVFEGVAIANFLKRQNFKKEVYIDALCASIATVIALGCGGTVHMYKNSLLMIHNAWSCVCGNAAELRKKADDLEICDKNILSVYVDKCKEKSSEEDIKKMMDEETWLNSSQSLELGFIDDIIEEDTEKVALLNDFEGIYNNIPESLIVENHSEENEKIEMDEETKRILDEAERTLKLYELKKGD